MPTPLDSSIGMMIDAATGALYATVTSPDHHIWCSLDSGVPELNHVSCDMVREFVPHPRVDLLASDWSAQEPAVYTNIWTLRWPDAGYAQEAALALHRSLDRLRTCTPVPIR